MPKLAGNGAYEVEVSGESHYQDNLIRVAGKQTRDGRRVQCQAELFLETGNRHDPSAIRVEIGGKPVGYIPRYLAPELRASLKSIGVADGQRVGVDAVIVGGRTGEHYGVWLDIDQDDDDEEGEEAQAVVAAAAIPVRPEPIMPESVKSDGTRVLVTILLVLVTLFAIALMFAYALR